MSCKTDDSNVRTIYVVNESAEFAWLQITYARDHTDIYPYSDDYGSQIDHIFIKKSYLYMVEYSLWRCKIKYVKSCNIPRFSNQRPAIYRWDKADDAIYRDILEGCVIVEF